MNYKVKMIDNSKLPDKLNDLTALSNQVQRSTEFVLGQLSSWKGHFVLGISKKFGFIPDWAERYIELTREFQRTVHQFKDRLDAELPEIVIQVQSESSRVLSRLILELNSERYLEISRPEGCLIDQSSLLRVSASERRGVSIAKSRHYWYQNLGLLMNVYRRTEEPELKKLIAFLALNYLGKAAPICPCDLSLDNDIKMKLYDMFQLSLLEPGISYNRESSVFETYLNEAITEALAAASGNQFFLIDTKNIEALLRLRFYTVENPEFIDERIAVEFWTPLISKKIEQHFAQYPEGPLNEFFEPPLLVDLTLFLEQDIYASGISEKNAVFEKKLRLAESWLEQAIDRAILPFCKTKEELKKLKALVITNMTCICRCELNGVGILKLLPLFYNPEYVMCDEGECALLGERQDSPKRLARILLDIKSCKSIASIDDFLNCTGIRLGSVKGRMKVFEFMNLEQFLEKVSGAAVEYIGEGENCIYFNKPLDLVNTSLFKRFEHIFDFENADGAAHVATKPYLRVLGKSTLSLAKGLLIEINEEQWTKINSHHALRQIVQTSLFNIHTHLAEAEMFMDDFAKFSQSIELIHYEMAALLTVFCPFKDEDFPDIFKNRLVDVIPEELRPYVKAGLTKSAMNTFAGMSVALTKTAEHPVRAFDPGSHFEIVQFIGESHRFDNVIRSGDIQKVDLFLAEFNHNVKLLHTHEEYTPGDVINEVGALLEAKPLTQHLTIAVDSTIDFISSPKAKAVLEYFAKDIKDGKLNFVFFRSGQKFDLLGMDNYYGSPWYMVNNGDSHWAAFDILTTSEAFKTDILTTQWFCLVNKHAPAASDQYRKAIFDNAKEVLQHVPEVLLPGQNPKIKVCRVTGGMEPAFIDIKCFGKDHESIINTLETYIYKLFTERNIKIHSRGGYGYFNPNINLFMQGLDKGPKVRYTTMRLHPGINPEENALLINFLEEAARIAIEE